MLTIDFLTDYVCPFCLVTKENLRAALKTLHQEAEIIEHPYALTPEGSEPTDICDEEHRAYFARLKEPAETVGLNMQLPPEIRPRPMTYLAFEGAVLAEKSRAGHTAEVKALLLKHGADKLSDIDPAEYPALLADAEVL